MTMNSIADLFIWKYKAQIWGAMYSEYCSVKEIGDSYVNFLGSHHFGVGYN